MNVSIFCPIIFVMCALSACADSPDRLRDNLPNGLQAGKTLYYNTEWFECAVAVYELDAAFADQILDQGIGILLAQGDEGWRPTPPAPVFEDAAWATDMYGSIACIEDANLRSVFENLTSRGRDGFFHPIEFGSTTIIAPAQRLIMVGGYD